MPVLPYANRRELGEKMTSLIGSGRTERLHYTKNDPEKRSAVLSEGSPTVSLNNSHASVWSAIAIALEAGISIGAAYMATRSLWFAMGLHTAWNFLQGTIFGVAVSGRGAPTESLFQPRIQGNPWLTGGAFGIEASVIAVVLGLGVGIFFITSAVRQKRIMRGLWWRGGINVLRNVS